MRPAANHAASRFVAARGACRRWNRARRCADRGGNVCV
ncbi:hypothetical protein BURPS305_2249 [Burkholderia pseudomallei 305]|nr:hypothetical protein BURPS305_2249 [Burkholderia pseudomallei 305]